MINNCIVCGNKFKKLNSNHKTCVDICSKKWRKEYKKKHAKKYYQKNKSVIDTQNNKWKYDNMEFIKKWKSNWYNINKNKITKQFKINYKNNKVEYIRREQERRARLNGCNLHHSTKEWEDLKQKYHNMCPSCLKIKPLTKDHIIPLIKGGENDIENIQPLCMPCNNRKYIDIIKYPVPKLL